ncbi:MAG: TonB-dependent receptor [Chlorobia bacterium]|nr:TonB-dependent receptor [Fimbriimonadaceae bacterium]
MNHISYRLTLSVLALLVCTCSFAQEGVAKVKLQLAKRQLRPALETAQAAFKDSKVGAELQMLGVLQLANGRPKEAEDTFTKAIELAAENRNTPSGLEEESGPNSALASALSKIKPIVSLEAGLPSAHNGRGIARYVSGDLDGAISDFDIAAVMVPEWGLPWINSSLALLESGRSGIAVTSGRKGLELGLKSSRAFAILGEVEMTTNQFDRSRDSLRKALEKDPDDPFALLANAKLLARTGNSREAERALAQALANGATIVVDSSFLPASGKGSGIGGATTDNHLHLVHQGLPNPNFGYRAIALIDILRQENRGRAIQEGTYLELTLGGTPGTLFASYRNVSGGRPGLEDGFVGLNSTSGAEFDFKQTSLLWQKRFDLKPGQGITLHAGYRNGRIRGQQSESAPTLTTIKDEQWVLDARWDSRISSNVGIQIGTSYSELRRSGAGGTPLEPVEQIFGNGKSRIFMVYGLGTISLTEDTTLLLGGALASIDDEVLIEPIGDVVVRLAGDRSLRFKVRNRMADAAGNLFPLALLPESPQPNAIDRKIDNAQAFNNSPTFFEEDGRHKDYECALEFAGPRGMRFETFLFYRGLNNIRTQSSDPRLAPDMVLTPLQYGSAGGIGQRIKIPLNDQFGLRLYGAFQTSRCKFETPTYDAGDYPLQNPASSRTMPNFPSFQGSAIIDWAKGGWSMALEMQYLGERRRAVTVNTMLGDVTYLSDAPSVTGLHLHSRYRVGNDVSLFFSVFNLTGVGFYPGYGGATTGVLGFQYRF